MSKELSTTELLDIIHRGIAAVAGLSRRPKRVVIVGAGVAGLVAGYELLRAGHDPLILEARNHPQITAEFEVGASYMWHDDEFAGGAFALFEPGQQTLLHDAIIEPEGRFHFAGEHASLHHAWIQGAIESGLRAAAAVHRSA